MKDKLREIWENVKDKAIKGCETIKDKAIDIWNQKGILIVAIAGVVIICLVMVSSIVKSISMQPKEVVSTSNKETAEVATLTDDVDKKEVETEKKEPKEDGLRPATSRDHKKEDSDDDDEKEDQEKKEFAFYKLEDLKDVVAIYKAYSSFNVQEGNHATEVAGDDYYIASTESLSGLIDSKGNWVLKPEYSNITYSGQGYILTKNDKHYVFANDQLSEITDNYLQYEIDDKEAGGCAWNTDYSTLCLLSATKAEIQDFKYQQSKPMAVYSVTIDGEAYEVDGKIMSAYTSDPGKFAIVNGNKCMTGFDFESATAYSDGLIAVKKGGKWGYADEKGKIVIECKYDGIRNGYSTAVQDSVDFAPACTEGYVVVCKKGKYAVLNKEGKLVVPYARYDYISEITDGRCFVFLDDAWGMISVTDKNLKGTLQKDKHSIKIGELLDAEAPDSDEDLNDEDSDKKEEKEDKKEEKKPDETISTNDVPNP